jgi:uncharacterized protein (TIGR02246 family)
MTTKASRTADEEQIRQLIDSWRKALCAKDIDGLMSHYLPDVLLYDLAPPLVHRGAETYRKSWEEWLPTFQGPVGYEIHDLSITTGDEVAFSTSLNRISGTRTNGEQTDIWMRATVCYLKNNTGWMVTHEHVSVPFYMDGSYKAAVDLKP